MLAERLAHPAAAVAAARDQSPEELLTAWVPEIRVAQAPITAAVAVAVVPAAQVEMVPVGRLRTAFRNVVLLARVPPAT
jgi:hypothetical protein